MEKQAYNDELNAQKKMGVQQSVTENGLSAFLWRIKSAFEDGRLDLAVSILSQAAKYVSETSDLSSSRSNCWDS